jgi:hypothetical protein
MFLGVGGGAAKGTMGLGLQDLAVKGKIKPMAGWTLKADYHWFWTAEGVQANPTSTGLGAMAVGKDLTNILGNELDITAVTKMNANTKIMIGYSNFTTSRSMRQMKNLGANDINWGYVQFDVKF